MAHVRLDKAVRDHGVKERPAYFDPIAFKESQIALDAMPQLRHVFVLEKRAKLTKQLRHGGIIFRQGDKRAVLSRGRESEPQRAADLWIRVCGNETKGKTPGFAQLRNQSGALIGRVDDCVFMRDIRQSLRRQSRRFLLDCGAVIPKRKLLLAFGGFRRFCLGRGRDKPTARVERFAEETLVYGIKLEFSA